MLALLNLFRNRGSPQDFLQCGIFKKSGFHARHASTLSSAARAPLSRVAPYKSNASLLGAGPAGTSERSGCGSGVPGSRKRLVIG